MKIGVLGGGQLGRMMGVAALRLGVDMRYLDPDPNAAAGAVGPLTVAPYDDLAALEQFTAGLDIVTYEFENVPARAADWLTQHATVLPTPRALEASQDRLVEKNFFRGLGIATADFAEVGSLEALRQALAALGTPSILKTRRLGYDGKGQHLLRDAADAEKAWTAVGQAPCILETVVPFDREVSIIVARAPSGERRAYPLVENHHREGILRLSLAPAPNLTPALQQQAEQIAAKVLEKLDYVGILTIELFQRGDDLLANEMACRVHNSGHWTIEGSETSQFENHLRAITGWPLGSTATRKASAMINLIGTEPRRAEILAVNGAHLHMYAKNPRPGRKVGHITIVGDSQAEIADRVRTLRQLADG